MLDEQLLYVTTLITAVWQGKGFSGTGFFFQQREPAMNDKHFGNYWLVTNRHVLYSKNESDGRRHLVDQLTFRVRALEKTSKELIWIEVTLSQAELLQKAKVLSDQKIDVAVIDICNKVEEELIKYKNLQVNISPIEEDNLADKSNFPIEVSDDVIVIGYPQGFYDTVNLYPIVKSGIIASKWGAEFRGNKGFAIDAKLFPGSSGSLVITKPRMEDFDKKGNLIFKKNKVFYCLGIYSGDPIFEGITTDDKGNQLLVKYSFDLGHVWYYHLILETINTGIAPKSEI